MRGDVSQPDAALRVGRVPLSGSARCAPVAAEGSQSRPPSVAFA